MQTPFHVYRGMHIDTTPPPPATWRRSPGRPAGEFAKLLMRLQLTESILLPADRNLKAAQNTTVWVSRETGRHFTWRKRRVWRVK